MYIFRIYQNSNLVICLIYLKKCYNQICWHCLKDLIFVPINALI